MNKFYLGTHRVKHMEMTNVPLFISRRLLENRKTPVKSKGEWALDSGGFTELSRYGRWTIDAQEYISQLAKINETPNLSWAAQQDWMCEDLMIQKTGLNVKEHIRRTVQNFKDLQYHNTTDVHIIPVLQGKSLDDYIHCYELFEANDVYLPNEKLVGLGSVCRRQNLNEIEKIVSYFHSKDLKLHGFGVKTLGLKKYGEMLESSDSMAWSFGARRKNLKCEHGIFNQCPKPNAKVQDCRNCLGYAIEWRSKVMRYVI